jgi:hypothetical protein
MTSNFTFESGLVTQLPSGQRPVGRESFTLIVMEHIGSGWRYYGSLAPGQVLPRTSLFKKFIGFAVDMRPARELIIDEQFPSIHPLVKVHIRTKILYHVIDPRALVVEFSDPLGQFKDLIITTLRRDVGAQEHRYITEASAEQSIDRLIGQQLFALTVERVNRIELEHDQRLIGIEYGDPGDKVKEYEREKELRELVFDLKKKYVIDEFQSVADAQKQRDLLLQEIVKEFLKRNPDLDPEKLREQVRRTFEEINQRPEVTFDNTKKPYIVWGKLPEKSQLPSLPSQQSQPPPSPSNDEQSREDDDR